jgi:3-oxoacyl-[acyl-carrier protein] reductase
VVADVQQFGQRGLAYHCDISDAAAARAFYTEAEAALGQVDILVNNAGVSEEVQVENIVLKRFDWMINVHLRATFVLSQLAYVGMKVCGFGRIINISSNLAYKGAPSLAHYSAEGRRRWLYPCIRGSSSTRSRRGRSTRGSTTR